jgi:hypothetical protein
MTNRGWVVLACAGIACIAGACALVDPVDNRYDTVSRSLAKARNESIFLNLVRASHDYPLSFTVVSNVTPSLTNTSSLGLPSFLFGPHIIPVPGSPNTGIAAPQFTPGRDVIFGNTTASNSTAVSTNFNVSTQETSAFYEGFLKPIDLTTLAYFIRQGYSRELLFWLFTDSFELDLRRIKFGYHYAPPDDYGCAPRDPRQRCFLDWIHLATLTGLTVEELTAQKSGGGGSGGKGGGSEAGGAKASVTAFSRFCLNPVLAQQAEAAVSPEVVTALKRKLDVPFKTLFNPKVVCGGPWDPLKDLDKPQPDILPLQFGRVSFKIVPRSAYGVFEFLGTVMKMQRLHIEPGPGVLIPAGRDDVLAAPILATVHDDSNLMTVTQYLGGECFVHTWFKDGDYCVPEDAATTKRIFSLLAQLIAIQTAATDLSITPIVRVIQ